MNTKYKRPIWLQKLNNYIHAGHGLIKSYDLLDSFTPDIELGSLKVSWISNSFRYYPGYYNIFNGYYEVYRNDKLIWKFNRTDTNWNRLLKLLALEAKIDIKE